MLSIYIEKILIQILDPDPTKKHPDPGKIFDGGVDRKAVNSPPPPNLPKASFCVC